METRQEKDRYDAKVPEPQPEVCDCCDTLKLYVENIGLLSVCHDCLDYFYYKVKDDD